jgi:hypothetical protein
LAWPRTKNASCLWLIEARYLGNFRDLRMSYGHTIGFLSCGFTSQIPQPVSGGTWSNHWDRQGVPYWQGL